MKYYLHDSNAFNDEKVSELFLEFGYEGLGLFYTLLEKLAAQEKPVKTTVLKAQLKVGKKLEKCWNFMESIELISSNNGETFNKQLLNFSEKYKIKKEKNAKRISEWRDKQKVTENVTHSENVRNASKVKESKVKESKVNIDIEKKGFSPPSFDDLFNYFLEKKPNTNWTNDKCEVQAKKFLNFYDSKNWFVGKNRMAKWKAAASGWIEREKEFNNGNQNKTNNASNRPAAASGKSFGRL